MPTRDDTGPDHEELLLLWGARRAGVLDALTSTAGTTGEVAAETGIAHGTSARFVRLLAAYGYLRAVEGEYEVTNRALGFLATRDLRSVGATPAALDEMDAMAELGGGDAGESRGRGVATDQHDEPDTGSAGGETLGSTSDRTLRHRLGAHAATPDATVRAGVTAAVHAAPDAERVVDVCGASGVYATEFVRRGRAVTMVDSRERLDVVEPMLAGGGVETAAAETLTDVPVDDADLALLAGVLQRHGPETNRALLTSVHDALAPGGTVVILEPLRERSPGARRIAVERLAVGRGDAYGAEEVHAWLTAAGFVDRSVRDVPGTVEQAVVARRERGVE